jgi:short-subunit dehydrogenase
MRRLLIDARVLLTGASSGIGRELALALARRRAKLLLAARRGELLASIAEECRRLGAQVEFLAGDITDAAFRAGLIDRAAISFSGLDVLINNAGVSAHGPFEASDEATLRRIMEVNFFAATEACRRTASTSRANSPCAAGAKRFGQNSPAKESASFW